MTGRPLPRLPEKPSHVAVWVSRLAAERVAEHFAFGSSWDVVSMLDAAEEMQVEVVRGLLRRVRSGAGDRYFLGRDRAGIFVLAPSWLADSAFKYTLVTYIRLSPLQIEQVENLYPRTT